MIAAPKPSRLLYPYYGKSYRVGDKTVRGVSDDYETGDEIDYEIEAAFSESEGYYLEQCADETGCCLEASDAAARETRDLEILAQSREIARRLGNQGVNAYRQSPFWMWRFWIHSRSLVKEPLFRRITFIPYVAQRLRAPTLNAVEAWLQRNPFARMWTFTSGPRVPLGELRGAIRTFHRRLSKLADFLRPLGVEMVFRATELGTPEVHYGAGPAGPAAGSGRLDRRSDAGSIEMGPDGTPYFHVHAHTVIRSTVGYRKPAEWDRLIRSVWAEWGDHWDAGESVRDARELVKYVTKPSELLRLSAADLALLSTELRRLKLVHMLGCLAAEVKDRKQRRKRLAKRRTRDGAVWEEAPDWNAHRSKTRAEKELAAALKLGTQDTRTPDFRVVARSMPSFAPGGRVKEPCVSILAAVTPDLAAVLGRPEVARVYAATVDAWAAGCALVGVCSRAPEGDPIRVHVCTSTVLTGPPAEPPDPFECGPPDPF